MREFWVSSGHHLTVRTRSGGLAATDDLFRAWLARPELTPPDEACRAERMLHARLMDTPVAPVTTDDIDAMADSDARENWRLFLDFRTHLLEAPTLETAYSTMARHGFGSAPPVFIDQLVHLILRNALDDCEDPFALRAAELFFRMQRASIHDGRLVLADAETVDRLAPQSAQSPLAAMFGATPACELDVMTPENAWTYWSRSDAFSMAMTLSEPKARAGLARVIEIWLSHLCGVAGAVQAVTQAEDADWRWFIGLDAEATALGDRLWNGGPLTGGDTERIVGLFRLTLGGDPRLDAERCARPIWLILAMGRDGTIRLKPQNLVAGLPWRSSAKVS